MTNDKKTEYRAPALEKGLDILELLAATPTPLTKKQIAEKLDRSVSEIFRMLSVLVERKYIEYDNEQSAYSLSLRMFVLSNQHPPIAQMLKRAIPLMEELSLKVNQSCHLSQYKHGELVVIGAQESPYKMGFGLRLGASLDICSSGSGIVLLTFSSEEKRREILEKTNATENEIAHALGQVDKTQKDGFYVGPSPQISGVTNISFPIFGALGELMAVITIPFMTLNSKTVHHHIEDIEETKHELGNVASQLSLEKAM
ncbi:IclR family transcriptional regulator (plasmid) [Photobacterium sp. DA100]|uniref:IclR family transcriptional regulator n=1 Tax=Photobacterium sp. DA100 TaxID=3027472 RepID=UPI0024795DC7|nr:IclR family transcriptional regulator [Photobacterium sp. DA100]WEM44726.1 IclR family transcriptional regulator [Photobacterium sp. DA100]